MKDRNHIREIDQIRASSVYSLDGRVTDEERLSAFFRTTRKSLLSFLFHPKDRPGLPYLRIGSRHVCTVKALEAYLDQHAAPQATSIKPARRRPGRAKRGVNRSTA